jgi:hypothetical protein
MKKLEQLELQLSKLELTIRTLRLTESLVSEARTNGCTNGCTGSCPDPTGDCTYGCTNGCTKGCTDGCVSAAERIAASGIGEAQNAAAGTPVTKKAESSPKPSKRSASQKQRPRRGTS